MSIREEMVILIATNDSYIEAFGRIWWTCFKYYWPDCQWPVVFVTPNNKITGLPTIRITKYEGWNRMVRDSLKIIDDIWEPETVLLIHEDFLVGPQRHAGAFNRDVSKCVRILREDNEAITVGLIQKDKENGPYPGWPEMLGYHGLGNGILPVDPAGISLWRTMNLRAHVAEVIEKLEPEKDIGRQGVVEYSFLGSVWAKERNQCHLRVKQGIIGAKGVLNMMLGVTLNEGKLKVVCDRTLAIVETALGKKLADIRELDSVRDKALSLK
jgi:hypothetical protein